MTSNLPQCNNIFKNPNMDSPLFANFRLISNEPFLSKILDKIVLNQLQSYLSHNSINEKCQSGFKSCHSTESALLRFLNDIMLTDSGQFMALPLIWSTMIFLYLVLKHVLVYEAQY